MADNLVACDVAGRIARIAAPVGHIVSAGDAILVVDASGFDVIVDAPVAGRIKHHFFAADEMLPEAAVVAVIET